jgi:lysozyme family protein
VKENFDACLKLVFKWEGGWSDHPEDNGGKTNFGITQARYSEYLKDIGVKDQSVAKITRDTAAKIYKKYYWHEVNGDFRPLGVDLVLFDFAVNSGPSRARRYASVVAKPGLSEKEDPQGSADGIRSFINVYCDARLKFVRSLGDYRHFGKGWERRIADIRAKALLMISTNVDTPVTVESRPGASNEVHSTTLEKEPEKSWISRWF